MFQVGTHLMNEQQEQDRHEAVEGLFVETKLEPSAFCQYCHYKKEHCCCDLEID